jgi:hypothetical protein
MVHSRNCHDRLGVFRGGWAATSGCRTASQSGRTFGHHPGDLVRSGQMGVGQQAIHQAFTRTHAGFRAWMMRRN